MGEGEDYVVGVLLVLGGFRDDGGEELRAILENLLSSGRERDFAFGYFLVVIRSYFQCTSVSI